MEDKNIKEFIQVTKKIFDDEMYNKDVSKVCIIDQVNPDYTLNIKIPPDENTIIRNVSNQTPYSFQLGDLAQVYLIGGRLQNCFVIAKYTPKYEESKNIQNIVNNINNTNQTEVSDELVQYMLRTINEKIQENNERTKQTINEKIQENNIYINQTVDDKIQYNNEYFYQVGALYLTIKQNDSPAARFGGNWELLPEGYALWTTESGAGGTTISAGLPNITGHYIRGSTNSLNKEATVASTSNTNGAFGQEEALTSSVKYIGNGGTGSSGYLKLTFDASQSNSIYGNSTTVQPPAIKVYAWRKIP